MTDGKKWRGCGVCWGAAAEVEAGCVLGGGGCFVAACKRGRKATVVK